MRSFALILCIIMGVSTASAMTVPEAITEVTEICPPTRYNCVPVTEEMHERLYSMQKSKLQSLAVCNSKFRHRFLLYDDFGSTHVVSTWTDNNKDFYIADMNMKRKSLHQILVSILPDYSYVRFYNRGRNMRYYNVVPRSRIIKGEL